MRDSFVIFMAVGFFVTAALTVTGLVSRTLLQTTTGDVTHGLWELCVQRTDLSRGKWDCSPFDWQHEVKDSVAADRVRSVQVFGTMAFIAGIAILISPLLFVLLVCCDVSHRVMSCLFVGTFWLMGLSGSVMWILLDTYFDDVSVDDYAQGFRYDWGAYVFMAGTGMTSLVVPVTLCCLFASRVDVQPL